MSIEELNVNLKMISDDIEVVDIFSIGGKYQNKKYLLYKMGYTSYVGIIDDSSDEFNLLPVIDDEEAEVIKRVLEEKNNG